MIALFLDVLAKATALLALAALAEAVLARRASAAARHLVWALVMAALIMLPLAIAALPHWDVRIPVARASMAAAAEAAGAIDLAAAPAGAPAAPAAIDAITVTPPPASAPIAAPAMAALTALYLAGVLLLLVRLAREPFALRRLTRESDTILDREWRVLLGTCARRVGAGRSVRLLRSTREVMPLTFGTLAPTIVVPASSRAWPDDRRRAVLLHELAHVARRDCLVQRLSALACAFYWPHPGVWWAARRLRVERELACDDRVLAAGAPAREYAGHLLELAHSLGRVPAPATALGMARAPQLEQRLIAILDAARSRGGLRRRGVTATIAIAGVVFVSMAVLRAAMVPGEAPQTVARSSASEALVREDAVGTWSLRRTSDPTLVQVTIRTARGSHGRTVRLDQLAGLPVDLVNAANAPVHVPIRRDAGTFIVDGVCRSGVCAGTYAFEADPAFADALARRDIGRPAPQDQLALALANAGLAYVDALAAAGYAKPDVQTLVRAAEHGVDLDYLRGMTTLGYRAGNLDDLMLLRDHGVDPGFIHGMQAAGYPGLSAGQLRQARDHGADPEYARGMTELGFGALPLPSLINARDHGVDPEYIRGMQALGHRLTLEEYLRARDHGIDPGYIRGMQALGHRLTLEDYLRTRDHGVDPEYQRGLSALGYTGLSVEALLSARDHGVNPEYVRGMSELGYKGLPLDTLIRLRDHGVDPEYVRRVQRAGAARLSVDELIQRRDRGGDVYQVLRVNPAGARIRELWRQFSAWLRS